MTPREQELLRRLSINDEAVMLDAVTTCASSTGSDHKVCALARIAALIATDSSVSSYQWAVDDAFANGATDAEIVGVLQSVAPIVGISRVASAAPTLALALGYDVEQELDS